MKNEIYKVILRNEQIIDEIVKELNMTKEEFKTFLLTEIDLIAPNIIEKIKPLQKPLKNGESHSTIYIDGGSRGNPGESGVGVVIETNNQKRGYYNYIGISTNNQAEYNALKMALDIAIKDNLKNIRVFSDSELLCNQINGRYKINNELLKAIFVDIKKLLVHFETFSIEHIRRENNKDADKLANMAMDNKNQGEVELTVAT